MSKFLDISGDDLPHLSACYDLEVLEPHGLYGGGGNPKYDALSFLAWMDASGYRHTTLPGHQYSQCVEKHGSCDGYLPPPKNAKYGDWGTKAYFARQ